MRVFVTGATGFIGSAVVKKLIDAGQRLGWRPTQTGLLSDLDEEDYFKA